MTDDLAVALSVDALGPRLTGIGRYCLELANRLPAKLGRHNLHYFRGGHWIANPSALLQEGWKPERSAFFRRHYDGWQRRRALTNAVVHAPNYFLPDWADRGVATIHDLSVLLYPETHPLDRVRAFEAQFDKTLRQAKMLITDTETVRQELITMFGIGPDRIQAVTLGAPEISLKPDFVSLGWLGLQNKQYILCVSTFEPRKRIDQLVRAFTRLPLPLRKQFPLILAGAPGWRSEALDELIAEASIDGTVKRIGFVPEASLGALYAGARLFIYPSRYEGFGLPVVEAMAHGVPCLIADTPCLIEVAQGAAKVVDPEDPIGFASAIHEALDDDRWQEDASRAGKAVARGYSWDGCATRMAEVYRAL